MNREEIASHISAMPSDLVKATVLQWLKTPGSLDDFGEVLFEIAEESDDNIDTTLGFPDQTEQEIIQECERRLANYHQTGQAIPHSEMKAWAESLGTPNEIPCPQ